MMPEEFFKYFLPNIQAIESQQVGRRGMSAIYEA
jgi:hypothetical protein